MKSATEMAQPNNSHEFTQPMANVDKEVMSGWIRAISEDNADKIKCILTQNKSSKNFLLYECLPWCKVPPCGHKGQCQCYKTHKDVLTKNSLEMCIFIPSPSCLKVLVCSTKDILQRPLIYGNVIHVLLHAVYYRKQQTEVYMEMYKWLSCYIDNNTFESLLLDEGAQGLVPLELSFLGVIFYRYYS